MKNILILKKRAGIEAERLRFAALAANRRRSASIAIIILALTLGIFALGAPEARAADYYAEGVVLSEDMLNGVSGEAWITGFTATSSVPASTTLGFLFSVDQENWYNSRGEEMIWDTMASGTAYFNLRALKWATSTLATTSLQFFYKARLTTNIATATPVVYEVSVEYSNTYDYTPPDYGNHKEGIMLSTDMLSGVSGEAWITGFTATSSVPASTTLGFLFSVDQENWYNSRGEKQVWDTMASGTAYFNLRPLQWATSTLATTSLQFFYKARMTSNIATRTPVIYDIEVEYSDTYDYTPPDYGYWEEGVFTSNILAAERAGAIEYFGYNLTSLPASTSARIMFSNDGANYYSATGTAWQWTALELGDHLSTSTGFDLTSFGWTVDLYYKIILESQGGTTTPVISGVKAWFTERTDSVEFTCIIDPDSGAGTDFSSLSLWQNAVHSDLTATSTLVFSYDTSTSYGIFQDNVSVIGETTGASGTLVHLTGTTSPATAQLLIKNITGKFMKGEKVYVQESPSSYAYLTDSGNLAIAVAQCRSTGGTADQTAVSITGWETSSTTYIKIWTDPDDPYGRHLGKWDDNKYRLEVPAPSSNTIGIEDEYTRIEGLQISYESISQAVYLDTGEGVYKTTDWQISHNIIKKIGTLNTAMGIRVYRQRDGAKIFNNIIYGFNKCYDVNISSEGDVLVYNNTVYNCTTGYQAGHLETKLINNIAQNCDVGFEDSGMGFVSGSDHNISSDWTAPGTNSITSTTVSFLDAANNDFHLSPDDTAARDAGISLFNDATSSFFTDIDGTARGAAWDIGADEVPVEFVSTICQATSTGGDCANLDYTYLARWEDKVETDLTAASTRVFGGSLTGNLSENNVVWLLDATGTTTAYGYVVATTSDQILIDGIVGSSTNPVIASTSYKWQLDGSNYWSVSGSGDDFGASPIAIAKIDGAWSASDTLTSYLDINGWTTDHDNYIKVYTTDEARHEGKWDYNKYRMDITNNFFELIINEEYVWIDGLQLNMDCSTINSPTGVHVSIDNLDSDIKISNNIIKADLSGAITNAYGIGASYSASSKGRIWNNIIYDWIGPSGTSFGIYLGALPGYKTWYVYNNTVYNCNVGFSQNQQATIIAKNNLIASTTDPFNGTFAAGTDYNATDIDDTPGVGTHNATSAVFSFVDVDNNDFHLAESDVGAKNQGMDLSGDPYLPLLTKQAVLKVL